MAHHATKLNIYRARLGRCSASHRALPRSTRNTRIPRARNGASRGRRHRCRGCSRWGKEGGPQRRHFPAQHDDWSASGACGGGLGGGAGNVQRRYRSHCDTHALTGTQTHSSCCKRLGRPGRPHTPMPLSPHGGHTASAHLRLVIGLARATRLAPSYAARLLLYVYRGGGRLRLQAAAGCRLQAAGRARLGAARRCCCAAAARPARQAGARLAAARPLPLPLPGRALLDRAAQRRPDAHAPVGLAARLKHRVVLLQAGGRG
jgi:hypothetical protein